MKKIIAAILAVLMLLSFVACSRGDNSDNKDSSAVGTPPVQGDEVDETYIYNNPNKNYAEGGEKRVISMLVRTQSQQFHNPTVTSGVTKIDNAVFQRNTMVEDQLGIKFEFSHLNGYAAGQADFKTNIRNANSSGDACYDIVSPAMFGNDLIIEGVWADINNSEYLNPEKGWWSVEYTKSNRMNGRLYTITGDLSVDMLRCMTVVYYNKGLYEDLLQKEYGDLYELVNDGKWTIETMFSMAKKVSADVDNDSKYDLAADDIFGFTCQEQFMRNFPTMSGIIYIENEDGDISTDFYNTRTVDLYDLVKTAIINTNTGLYGDAGNSRAMCDNFMTNQTLFHGASLEGTADLIKTMASDYGILINPKYNEDEEYITGSGGGTIFAIPTGAPDFEMSTVILEALGYYSYEYMRPAFFEGVLKGQIAQDYQSYDMLEKIRNSLYIDFALAFANDFTIWNVAFDKYLRSTSDTLTTFWAEFGPIYNNKINDLMSAIE